MSVTITATVGGANSNSYNTLEEFTQFCEERLGASAFDTAGPDDRKRALIQATRILERERWLGDRVTATQKLSHPRLNLPKVDQVESYGTIYGYDTGRVIYGEMYASDAIAPPVKEALNELALWLLAKDQEAADPNRRVKKFKADGLEVEYDYASPAQTLPDEVATIIAPLVRGNELMRA